MRSQAFHLILLVLLLSSCNRQAAAPQASRTPISPTTPSASPDIEICCGNESLPEGADSPLLLRRDGGQVAQGDVVKAEFTITNTSDEPARLHGEPKYSLPCCVTVKVEPELIPAQSEGKLSVQLDTKWRKGPTEVFVNLPFEGGQANGAFLLEVMVRPSFVVEPTSVDLSDGLPKEFIVGGPDLFKSFKVLKVEPTDPRIKVTERARLDDQIVYEVSWLGDAPGDKMEFVIVKTDHPKVKEYPVGVTPPGIDSSGPIPKKLER